MSISSNFFSILAKHYIERLGDVTVV